MKPRDLEMSCSQTVFVFVVSLLLIVAMMLSVGQASHDPPTVEDYGIGGLHYIGPPPLRPDGAPFFDVAVVVATWEELQPSAPSLATGGGWYETAWENKIKKKIIDSAKESTGLAGSIKLRIRIQSGQNAPTWLKDELGTYDPTGDCPDGGVWIERPADDGCVPFFWEPAYMKYYTKLLLKLRAEIAEAATDGVVKATVEPSPTPTASVTITPSPPLAPLRAPVVVEVYNTACMTLFPEPFTRAHNGDATADGSNQRLYDAGLRFQNDLACQEAAMAAHRAVFPDQRVGLHINDWDIIVGSEACSGTPTSWDPTAVPPCDPTAFDNHVWRTFAPVAAFASKWRAILGPRLVLENHGLTQSTACPLSDVLATPTLATTDVYCYMALDRGPKGFQTKTWTELGSSETNMQNAIIRGIELGACFVELHHNTDGFIDFTNSSPPVAPYHDLDERLEDNCPASLVSLPTPLPT